MIRNICASILCSALLFSCNNRAERGIEPNPDPQITEKGDETTYALDKPITLELLVNTPIKGNLRGALGSYDGSYDDTARARASVNTKDYENYSSGDADYDSFVRGGLDFYKADWVRNINIPELKPEDYKVEGTVLDITDPNKFNNFGLNTNPSNGKNIPDKITITFYRLPKSGILTFLANSKTVTGINANSHKFVNLSLENPYLITSRSWCIFNDEMKGQISKYLNSETNYTFSGVGSFYGGVFEPSYLPMYARLHKVVRNEAGDGIKGSETADGTAEDIHTIYLERAVSFVTIHWDIPNEINDSDHFVDEVECGNTPNVTSIVPNNWAGVKAKMTADTAPLLPRDEIQKTIPTYWDTMHDTSHQTDDESSLNRTGHEQFYTCENFPTTEGEQSTIYVFLTQFVKNPSSPAGFDVVGKRRYKYFELPYGEKNPETGLLEVRRNRWYNLHIKFKVVSGALQPYIVTDWTEIDIPTEL